MIQYKHTQVGYLTIVVFVIVLIFFAWLYGVILTEVASPIALIAIMALVLLILASFLTLTVTIDEQYIRVRFGYGLFWKTFELSQIVSVEKVKNHWYYGWGIRVWFWPYMWIFNVSGFDAVEIRMKNGRIYRIGTDAPQELEAAISPSIK